ncbi:hypothetical protein GUJ93_ZPchr0010g11001 [Zizania palustris]|uniref:Late embryogenesis abundant protein LEA-2 subgroup domain-containing protein n=1 Tax=Zizania palustris TaxID=103762 RepID=A0A8J6BDR8_ZIZPA|nr:hypothetical protein GUJ93_ZPchr0010g11001 [Zizania palustris]
MADHHHLPPEPVEERRHHKGGKAVLADDLKPRSRYGYYYGGGGGPARTLCFVVLVFLLLAGSPRSCSTCTTAAAGGRGASPASGPGAPTALAASFQFTLVIRNPNGRSAARYDRLAAYVSYRGEPITAPVPMPPLVQDADSAVAVAPVLGGGAPVPVSPDAAAALATDVSYGVLALRVVVLGRVQFVSGPFRSGWRSMYARCDLLVGVRKGVAGSPEAPLLGNPACAVDM